LGVYAGAWYGVVDRLRVRLREVQEVDERGRGLVTEEDHVVDYEPAAGL
jgi:hypothetical protein